MGELERIQSHSILKPDLDGYSSVAKIAYEFGISPSPSRMVEFRPAQKSMVKTSTVALPLITLLLPVLALLIGWSWVALLAIPFAMATGVSVANAVRSEGQETGSELTSSAQPRMTSSGPERLTESQAQAIIDVMSYKDVQRIEREYPLSQFPATNRRLREQAKESVRQRLNLPGTWGPDNAIEVQVPDTSDFFRTYLVKTAPDKVAIVEQRMVPEDEVWLDNFRACLTVD